MGLFVQNVITLWIVGTAIELAVFSVAKDQSAATPRTSTTGNGFITAFLVAVNITEMLLAVRFRCGDYLKKSPAIKAHLI